MHKLIPVLGLSILCGMNAVADEVVYVPKSKVDAAKKAGGVLSTGSDYVVSMSRRDKGGESEIHDTETDTFYIVEGSATFVTGGKLVDSKKTGEGQYRGSGITGGTEQKLSAGDVIIIPKGVAHWFKDVPKLVVYYVVKSKH